jgi:predicted O-linked N-acetylglucosamine transferase (SPINDLY family)
MYNKQMSIINLNTNLDNLFQEAFHFQENGKLQDAEHIYNKILQIKPSHIGAKTMLGMIFVKTRRDIDGIKLLKGSLSKDPKQFWAHNALGVGLLNIKKYQEAVYSFNRALILKPDYVDAYFNLGKTQRAMGKYSDAIDSYSKCIEMDKFYLDAYNNIGTVYLEDLHEYEKSVIYFEKFISLSPLSFIGYFNLGNALKVLKRYEEALANYERAIQINPAYAEAFLNCGVIFSELKRYEEALANYERAIQINPAYAEAYLKAGAIFNELKRFEEALANCERAIQIKPDIEYLFAQVIHTKMHLSNWGNLENTLNNLAVKIRHKNKVTSPFALLSLIDNLELQKQAAEIYVDQIDQTNKEIPALNKYSSHQKIRLGYFSADFHDHATMHLIAELFEHHDKSQFEIIAFSFGPDINDEWRQKAISSFDQFIDVRSKSDLEVAFLVREMEIDIAVDLKGFTQDSRPAIFSCRAAPVQVNYLGYPGTMGAKFIDYIIADQILIPEDKQKHFTEKIVYLPNSYQVNIKKRRLSSKEIFRKDVGLPEDAFVFCSFNNNYKITPHTFDRWMRILQSVDGSVLWILKSNDSSMNNLMKEAELRGVNSDRLVFASYLPIEEHLKRLQLADLFLDTHPYNAHTTASDALRVGLPLITLMGESFASRVAGSLLNAVNLSELITTHQDEYESLAIKLAKNPEMLSRVKNKLKRNLEVSPLYNIKLFTRHIELAYQKIYQRHQNKLAPDYIYIESN